MSSEPEKYYFFTDHPRDLNRTELFPHFVAFEVSNEKDWILPKEISECLRDVNLKKEEFFGIGLA